MPSRGTRPEVASTRKSDKDDHEKWTDEQTAPVPARVFQKRSLGIDEALLSRINSPRVPRIRSHLIDDVVPIGRRALEVAIMEAVSQMELHPRPSKWKSELSRILDACQDANAALARLFRAVDPDGADAKNLAPFIRQSRAGQIEASKAAYRDAAETALRDAQILVSAKQIVGKLRADTLARRDALAAIYPASSQDHQKRGFVRILAEGWVYLTGEMPGRNPDPLKNPFLRVVNAAWIDWHQEESSDVAAFGEALNAAISSIDQTRFNQLVEAGPEWA